LFSPLDRYHFLFFNKKKLKVIVLPHPQGTTLAFAFCYSGYPVTGTPLTVFPGPVVLTLSPHEGPISGGTLLSLAGTDLVLLPPGPRTAVTVCGNDCPVISGDLETVTCVVPETDLVGPCAVVVAVGTMTATSPEDFTYTNTQPTAPPTPGTDAQPYIVSTAVLAGLATAAIAAAAIAFYKLSMKVAPTIMQSSFFGTGHNYMSLLEDGL